MSIINNTEFKKEIKKCLKGLKIQEGDTVFMHSDAIVVDQFPNIENENGLHCFIDTIEEYLGTTGTLILPTFTYSFTKGEIYDIDRSPSNVGMITELFRQRSGVLRSPDPIFSVAASGKNRELFSKCDPYESFGPESVFNLLHDVNGWILGMGCSINSVTYTHYVEKCCQVDYRYEKRFSGTRIINNSKPQNCEVSYYVRDLSRKTDLKLDPLWEKSNLLNLLNVIDFERVQSWSIRSSDFFDTASTILSTTPNGLIEEGQKL